MPTTFAAKTPSQLARLAESAGVQIILDLDQGGRTSASQWTYDHPIAYRLLTSPPQRFLPILKDDHDAHCPMRPWRNTSQRQL